MAKSTTKPKTPKKKQTRKEITTKALARSNEAKAAGLKSVIFLPELSEFKEWLDAEIAKRDKSANSIATLAKKTFPKLNIPSAPTIKNYIDKHYIPKTVVAVGYNPNYLDYVAKFDTYLKLLEAAQEAWDRYVKARDDKSKQNIGKGATWFDKYTALLKDIFEIEVRLGIRNAIAVPKINMTQVNIGGNNQTAGPGLPDPNDVDSLKQLLKNKEIIDAADATIRAYAATRA